LARSRTTTAAAAIYGAEHDHRDTDAVDHLAGRFDDLDERHHRMLLPDA
jgi:hypothetical protein